MDKVINPLTGRQILINGPTFKKLVKDGVIDSKGELIKTKKSSSKKSSKKSSPKKSSKKSSDKIEINDLTPEQLKRIEIMTKKTEKYYGDRSDIVTKGLLILSRNKGRKFSTDDILNRIEEAFERDEEEFKKFVEDKKYKKTAKEIKEEKENVYGMYDKANMKYIIDILKDINPKIDIITNVAYSVHMDLIDLIYSILNTKDNIQEVIVKRTSSKLLSKFNKFNEPMYFNLNNNVQLPAIKKLINILNKKDQEYLEKYINWVCYTILKEAIKYNVDNDITIDSYYSVFENNHKLNKLLYS